MVYNVSATPEAKIKFQSHVEFLTKVSKTAAIRLKNTLKTSLEELSENPNMYPHYECEISDNLKYKLFSSRYRIVFEIVDDNVYIYDIQDCRQDTDKNFL